MMAVATMKRKLKWLAIVLTVSLLGFATAFCLRPRDRITVESWEKIRIGMTEKEVENILGSSGISWYEFDAIAKNAGKNPFIPKGPIFFEPVFIDVTLVMGQDKLWLGRRGVISITFDQEGHVGGKCFQELRSRSVFWDGLRDWLGW
jgi:hypothetical protein